jgi:hypothetical protein
MTNATLLQTQVTPNDYGIQRVSSCSLRAPCLNSGLRRCYPGVCVGRVEVTDLTLYHPHVASDGGVHFSQLSAKSLDLVLSGQQTSALLHRHILVVYHLHPGDIPFHPVGLELILLPLGQEVVDRVLQPTLIATDLRCDGLPDGIGNSITARSSEGWSLVSVEDPGSEENLCDGLELYSP